MSLPKPKDPRGYTNKEIHDICKERKISESKFNVVFGCNTCAYDAKTKKVYFYVCNVLRALHNLGHKDGKFFMWD